jgi:hypothetical protein
MRFPMRSLNVATGVSRILLAVFLLGAMSFTARDLVAKDFAKPVAHVAQGYPAHDNHPEENVAIAADPYDTGEKAKIFSINFREHGFLPVFFIVTNDGDQPISIASLEVKLITAHDSKLSPSSSEDIFRRLSNPQANTNSPIPFPIPHKKVKGTISQKEMAEVDSSQFAAKAVEPHSTQSGFLFFDIGGISSPLAGAEIDVTGVNDAKGKELMFFEIPMDKYLSAPQKTN